MKTSTAHRFYSDLFPRFLILSFFLAPLSELLHAQSYSPFHANTVAVYTTAPVSGRTSSLAFTDAILQDGDSIFYPVKTFDPEAWDGMLEVDWDNCEENFWSTGSMCHPADVPLWLGAEMRKTGAETYEYTNSGGEVLTFDFGIVNGDSALIYQNADMQLFLVAAGESAGNFLGIEETTFQYHLAHLDSEGVALGTALHEAPITLGAQLGAIHFMRIDSFPQVLQPISLVGHSGAEAGLYAVKRADVYDFQIGDIFQYSYQNNLDNPYEIESYYETRTVMDRVENESHIIYTYNVHRFTPDSTLNDTFDEEQNISKTALLAYLPFEMQYPEGPGSSYIPNGYLFQNLNLIDDSCGSTFRYSYTESFFHNCPVEGMACFGNTWHVAPSEWYANPSQKVYKQGFGMTFSYEGWSIVAESASGSETKELIYSSKDGIECGNQLVLSSENMSVEKQVLHVYPNPASSTVRLELPGVVLTNATLLDIRGVQVLDAAFNQSEPTLDISSLTKGIYMLKARSSIGEVYVTKLVVD